MCAGTGLELLTTSEAADYNCIKERKLYELIAKRQIPCTKVTGKWLLPRADVDRWLRAGMGWFLPNDRRSWAATMTRSCSGRYQRAVQASPFYRKEAKRDISASSVAKSSPRQSTCDLEKDANIETVASEATLYYAVLIGRRCG